MTLEKKNIIRNILKKLLNIKYKTTACSHIEDIYYDKIIVGKSTKKYRIILRVGEF